MNEITGVGLMKKKCKLEFFYVRNGDKTAPNTPDEVYSDNSTEDENIREILIYTRKFAGQLQHLRNKILYAFSY